jgi:hypothetical protein
MITEYKASENTTVIVAQRRQRQGWESFTIYSDADDAFVSYHKVHNTQAEAEERAAKLIKKFAR